MTAKTPTEPKAKTPRKAKAKAAPAGAAPAPETGAATPAQPVPKPQTVAQPAPSPAKAPRRGKGINLAPKAEAKACRAGTKQAILVDLLFRAGGASMAELLTALTPWKPVTVKSGLGWDMNHQKGYGIRTTHETGYERWLACDYEGMGSFRADAHPDDLDEAEKAKLLADNLASGYDATDLFPVYHLVLPAGLTAPVPHTVKEGV